ncbi:MAG: glutathione S-transferase [Rhizobiales bacterium NRL2]|nr:MAG: glutathione S-transferase [Rhizobiales bacterium NRL2]
MAIRMYDLCGAEPERRFSPFCWRARLALAHKGLEVETIPWRFTEKEAIAAHGSKTVPVILDGEKAVSDSWAIAEYLEDEYPDRPALFPNGRGEARFVKAWSEAVLSAGIITLVVRDIYEHIDPKDRDYFRTSREKRFGKPLEDVQSGREDRVRGFRQSLTPLRLTLQAQPWVAGEQPGFADHMCVAPLLWARAISEFRLLEADDPLNDWRNRMLDLYDGLARSALGYD